jgi:hypothetical protein
MAFRELANPRSPLQTDAISFKSWPSQTKRSRGIGWKTPLSLYLSIIVAIGFAIGHHFYLKSLHGGPVGGVDSQRTVKALNNLFPALVTVMLCISLSTAVLELVCSLLYTNPSSSFSY